MTTETSETSGTSRLSLSADEATTPEVLPGQGYRHPAALCESRRIGSGTRIWAFAHVLPGAVIGRDCNICDNVFVENDVLVGDRVTVKCGVQLWDGVTLEDDVFIGPNATFTNDIFPRSRQVPEQFLRTTVRRGASVGANATLLPGIEIGPGAMVGAGAVVTRSLPANAIAVGNPAQIVGYVGTDHSARPATPSGRAGPEALGVGSASLHDLPMVRDIRGSLTVGEFSESLPFVPKRYFMVYDVPSREVRGEHAHRRCDQFLICTRGSCSVLVDDGTSRAEVVLDRPTRGLYLPAMTWGTQYKYSADAVLLVFASEPYDASDYLRTYDDFLQAVGTRNA